MNFNDYNWHDAVIKNILINRNNPGILDEIIFDIEWLENEKINLVFEEVYWAAMNLNFGIVANETILNACVLDETDTDLINFYTKWKGMMNNVKLNSFEINLNSTGGKIKIIAKEFRIKQNL